jgi:hypothetical protein
MTGPRYATGTGMAQSRFSHAIAEGDGISVIAAVEDADSARTAEQQRAEALVVRGDPAAIRAASALPILWRAQVDLERATAVADAVMLVFDALDEEDGRLEELHEQAVELGLECAVEREDDETPLEVVLDLLAAVPAGKLAIADLPRTTPDEMEELERAGCDGVIVLGREVAALLGGSPPLEV